MSLVNNKNKDCCTICVENYEVIEHSAFNCPKSVCKECGVTGHLKKRCPTLLFMNGYRKSLQAAIKQNVILAKLKPKINTCYFTKTLPSLSWKIVPKIKKSEKVLVLKNDRSHGIFGQRRFYMEKIKKHSELFNETSEEQFDYAKSHGFGEQMLKKMGWNEGDGLGRVSYDCYGLHTIYLDCGIN